VTLVYSLIRARLRELGVTRTLELSHTSTLYSRFSSVQTLLTFAQISSKIPGPANMGNEYSKSYQAVDPRTPRSSGYPPPKAQLSKPQVSPPPYRVLERLPEETEDCYQARCAEIADLVANSSFFSGNISDELLAQIKWDTIPSKDWNLFRCRLWIRTYLIHKLNEHFRDATKTADRSVENGHWLVYMGLEDWIKLCRIGERSIWRLLEEYKVEGFIS
jgi:hypothetical protein